MTMGAEEDEESMRQTLERRDSKYGSDDIGDDALSALPPHPPTPPISPMHPFSGPSIKAAEKQKKLHANEKETLAKHSGRVSSLIARYGTPSPQRRRPTPPTTPKIMRKSTTDDQTISPPRKSTKMRGRISSLIARFEVTAQEINEGEGSNSAPEETKEDESAVAQERQIVRLDDEPVAQQRQIVRHQPSTDMHTLSSDETTLIDGQLSVVKSPKSSDTDMCSKIATSCLLARFKATAKEILHEQEGDIQEEFSTSQTTEGDTTLGTDGVTTIGSHGGTTQVTGGETATYTNNESYSLVTNEVSLALIPVTTDIVTFQGAQNGVTGDAEDEGPIQMILEDVVNGCANDESEIGAITSNGAPSFEPKETISAQKVDLSKARIGLSLLDDSDQESCSDNSESAIGGSSKRRKMKILHDARMIAESNSSFPSPPHHKKGGIEATAAKVTVQNNDSDDVNDGNLVTTVTGDSADEANQYSSTPQKQRISENLDDSNEQLEWNKIGSHDDVTDMETEVMAFLKIKPGFESISPGSPASVVKTVATAASTPSAESRSSAMNVVEDDDDDDEHKLRYAAECARIITQIKSHADSSSSGKEDDEEQRPVAEDEHKGPTEENQDLGRREENQVGNRESDDEDDEEGVMLHLRPLQKPSDLESSFDSEASSVTPIISQRLLLSTLQDKWHQRNEQNGRATDNFKNSEATSEWRPASSSEWEESVVPGREGSFDTDSSVMPPQGESSDTSQWESSSMPRQSASFDTSQRELSSMEQKGESFDTSQCAVSGIPQQGESFDTGAASSMPRQYESFDTSQCAVASTSRESFDSSHIKASNGASYKKHTDRTEVSKSSDDWRQSESSEWEENASSDVVQYEHQTTEHPSNIDEDEDVPFTVDSRDRISGYSSPSTQDPAMKINARILELKATLDVLQSWRKERESPRSGQETIQHEISSEIAMLRTKSAPAEAQNAEPIESSSPVTQPLAVLLNTKPLHDSHATTKDAFDRYDSLLDQLVRANKALKRGVHASDTSIGDNSEVVKVRVASIRKKRDSAIDKYDDLLDQVLEREMTPKREDTTSESTPNQTNHMPKDFVSRRSGDKRVQPNLGVASQAVEVMNDDELKNAASAVPTKQSCTMTQAEPVNRLELSGSNLHNRKAADPARTGSCNAKFDEARRVADAIKARLDQKALAPQSHGSRKEYAGDRRKTLKSECKSNSAKTSVHPTVLSSSFDKKHEAYESNPNAPIKVEISMPVHSKSGALPEARETPIVRIGSKSEKHESVVHSRTSESSGPSSTRNAKVDAAQQFFSSIEVRRGRSESPKIRESRHYPPKDMAKRERRDKSTYNKKSESPFRSSSRSSKYDDAHRFAEAVKLRRSRSESPHIRHRSRDGNTRGANERVANDMKSISPIRSKTHNVKFDERYREFEASLTRQRQDESPNKDSPPDSFKNHDDSSRDVHDHQELESLASMDSKQRSLGTPENQQRRRDSRHSQKRGSKERKAHRRDRSTSKSPRRRRHNRPPKSISVSPKRDRETIQRPHVKETIDSGARYQRSYSRPTASASLSPRRERARYTKQYSADVIDASVARHKRQGRRTISMSLSPKRDRAMRQQQIEKQTIHSPLPILDKLEASRRESPPTTVTINYRKPVTMDLPSMNLIPNQSFRYQPSPPRNARQSQPSSANSRDLGGLGSSSKPETDQKLAYQPSPPSRRDARRRPVSLSSSGHDHSSTSDARHQPVRICGKQGLPRYPSPHRDVRFETAINDDEDYPLQVLRQEDVHRTSQADCDQDRHQRHSPERDRRHDQSGNQSARYDGHISRHEHENESGPNPSPEEDAVRYKYGSDEDQHFHHRCSTQKDSRRTHHRLQHLSPPRDVRRREKQEDKKLDSTCSPSPKKDKIRRQPLFVSDQPLRHQLSQQSYSVGGTPHSEFDDRNQDARQPISSPHRDRNHQNVDDDEEAPRTSSEKRRLLGEYSDQTRQLRRDLDLARLTSLAIRNSQSNLSQEMQAFKKKLGKHRDCKRGELDILTACHVQLDSFQQRMKETKQTLQQPIPMLERNGKPRHHPEMRREREVREEAAERGWEGFTEIKTAMLSNLNLMNHVKKSINSSPPTAVVHKHVDEDTERLLEMQRLMSSYQSRNE